MAKAKAKTMIIHLFSTAQTGYFYTTKRLRVGPPLTQIKYDPLVKRKVLFLEKKKKK